VVNVTALQNAFLSSNITISTGSSGTQTGNLNLATDLTWANSATLTLSLAGGFTGTGNVHMSGTGTLSINQAGNSTYSGAISGASGKLTKSGAGTLTLTGNNSYGGLTTLSGGNLNLGSANAIGTTGAISFLGGTLQYSAANTTDYVGRFTANQTYRIDTNDQNVTLPAVLSGTSGLIKLGSGTLTLTGANTYTGLTTISAGTLALSDAGSISTSSSVANSGVFDISATTSGTSVKYITGSGATVLGSKTLTFTNVGTGQSYAGVISGTGGLVMPGSGSFTLSGNNTYTGSTTIPSGGTLMLGAAGASGSLAGSMIVGGTLTINRTGSLTLNGPISGAGTFNFSNGTLTLAGDNTFSGTFNWSSAGNLTLSGANAWPAITVTSTKTLFVSGQGSLPNTVVTLSGSTATLDISGATSGVTLKGLTSNYPAGKVVLGSNTLTLAMPDGASSSMGFGGSITGTGGISVINTTGSGMATLNFSASSAYTGLTTRWSHLIFQRPKSCRNILFQQAGSVRRYQPKKFDWYGHRLHQYRLALHQQSLRRIFGPVHHRGPDLSGGRAAQAVGRQHAVHQRHHRHGDHPGVGSCRGPGPFDYGWQPHLAIGCHVRFAGVLAFG
jgi:autotransporter-associated beta strand protein